MMLTTSCYQILDQHIIIDMFCLKWTSHHMSHLKLHPLCGIALRNPFSQNKSAILYISPSAPGGCRGCDRMVVRFTTTYAISAYPLPLKLWVWILHRQGVFYITLCDKVYQWLATGWWFSPGTLVFSTNKTDCHDITEMLLKVALSTINQSNQPN